MRNSGPALSVETLASTLPKARWSRYAQGQQERAKVKEVIQTSHLGQAGGSAHRVRGEGGASDTASQTRKSVSWDCHGCWAGNISRHLHIKTLRQTGGDVSGTACVFGCDHGEQSVWLLVQLLDVKPILGSHTESSKKASPTACTNAGPRLLGPPRLPWRGADDRAHRQGNPGLGPLPVQRWGTQMKRETARGCKQTKSGDDRCVSHDPEQGDL